MVLQGILQLPCALQLSSEAHAPPLFLCTTTLLYHNIVVDEVYLVGKAS